MTAASAEAVQAGIEMLTSGGNAADAAVAVLLTSCVTQIGAVCLGGEAAVIAFDAATGTARVFAAQGAAPGDPQAIDAIRTGGLRESGIRAATTPATLDLCVALLRELGSMTFAQVAAPVLALLARGRPATYFDTLVCKQLDALTGEIAEPGEGATSPRAWWVDLTRSLERLAESERSSPGPRVAGLEAVADRFYRGDIADELAVWYREKQGFLRKQDLEAHRTALEHPLSLDYRDYRVLKAGTWTQGLWLLQALRLLEGFNVDMETNLVDRCHLVAEAIKLSLADSDRHFGDPRFVDVPTASLLSREYAAARRTLIEPFTAGGAPVPGDPVHMRARLDESALRVPTTGSSTIACITADRFGNMVVMTPSGAGSRAGSGGETGVTHGTRLRSARASDESGRHCHPNIVEPGKRPCVTLSPTLVLRSGKPFLGISVPGGYYQDQAALHLLLELLDRGSSLDDVIERDAQFTPVLVDWVSRPTVLRVQKKLLPSVADELARRGHRVEPTSLSFLRLGGCLVRVDPDSGELDAVGPAAAAC